jgi:SAM-dependent methyltransferase
MCYDNRYFEARVPHIKARDKIWTVIANYLQRYIPLNSRILDLGAGYCSFINNIKGSEKHALDLWEGINKYAAKDVTTHIRSCTNLQNLASEYFDVIFASNLLEHLTAKEIDLTLSEIKRVLKPGGILILLQPNFRYAYRVYFDDYTHKTIFTDKGLCDLLVAKGFKINRVVPKFLPFSMKGTKLPPSPFMAYLYIRSPIKPFAKQMLVIAERS